MVIVGGTFEVDPDRRDEFLSARHDLMLSSRAEEGCIEYAFAADPLDPTRVVLFERWASQENLDAHLQRLQAAPPSSGGEVKPTSVSITVYDVAGERPLVR